MGSLSFLQSGGEMGKVVGAMDWSRTPLGPIESWPQSLRTSISLSLASNFPISIAWGPQRVLIYNDGYWPICGAKHPHSMGQDFKECWLSAWPVIGAAFEQATAGRPAFLENERIFIDRNGYLEETFFTFSFSPILDDTGQVAGLFHPVTEVTQASLVTRRLKVFQDLADRTANARTVAEVCGLIASALDGHERDLPFVLLYLVDHDGGQARLMSSTGLAPESAACPQVIDLASATGHWPLAEAAQSGQLVEVGDLQRLGLESCRPYPEAPNKAFLLPLRVAGLSHPAAVLVAGVSARRPLDDPYRAFYALLRESVTTALGNARAYEEERARAEALAELDRAKTAFFSNVSHEFRTPLTLMLGPIEDELRENPLASERLRVVHRNALRLLKLVNTLLDFSRIEAGRVQASYEPTDLAAATVDLASVFRSAIEKVGLYLRVDCPPLPQPVHVDREMWEKIVLNLLSNALKFSFEGGIDVTLRWHGDHVALAVKDTGIGIPAADVAQVFERFNRVRGARSRTHEGTGIGLSLVQELSRLHGGVATVQSTEGAGTTFTITLPTGTAHLPPDRIVVAQPRRLESEAAPYVAETVPWMAALDGAVSPVAIVIDRDVSLPVNPRADKAIRIVWADDNADMRDYVRRLLAPMYDVEVVSNGDAALAAVRRQRPNLVLADVMMPGLDGFGLLRALRADVATAHVPVILLSARAGEESRLEGMDAGADDYLVKPFNARELLARVEAHVKLSRLREEASSVLRQSEGRFRAFVQASSDVVYRMSPDWREMRHLDGREFIPDTLEPSRTWLERYIHPDDQPLVVEAIARAVDARTVFELEHRIIRADGTLGWTHSRAIPILDEHDQVAEWFGAASDVTARKVAEQKLQDADRRKDEFIATLAHELRNPLAPIRTGLELLRLGGDNREAVERVRQMMERQIGHMVRLIDDLLDVSRITSGKIRLQRTISPLASLVQGAIEANRKLFTESRVELVVDVPHDPIWVDVDPTRMVQVLSNVLHNAAKFTDAGGRVTLAARLEDADEDGGSAVAVAITDTGVGISSHMLPRVFDLFAQEEERTERAHGGLGIGLALARRLVELQGGTIEGHSDGPGKGATFTMRLDVVTPSGGHEAHGRPETGRMSTSGRVLVIDDNADAANTLAALVHALGGTAEIAFDGQAGLNKAMQFQPDVVLLDIGMPGISGYETCRQLRHVLGSAVTIVAVTGWGQPQDLAEASRAGFDTHLTKPADPAVLEQILMQVGQP